MVFPKSISIIGAGWLGSPLAVSLVKEGMRVVASSRSEETLSELKENSVIPVYLDLNPHPSNFDSKLFSSEVIFINIPPRNLDEDDNFHFKQLNWLADQIEQSSCERVIFISSTAIYDNNNSTVTEEDASSAAISRSGVNLMQCENIMSDKISNDVLILRFGGLLGAGRHPIKFLSGKTLHGGEEPVNMIHLDDCISIIKLFLLNSELNGIFNAVSDHHQTKREFYHKAATEFELPAPNFEGGIAGHKRVSNEKLKQALNYEFKYKY